MRQNAHLCLVRSKSEVSKTLKIILILVLYFRNMSILLCALHAPCVFVIIDKPGWQLYRILEGRIKVIVCKSYLLDRKNIISGGINFTCTNNLDITSLVCFDSPIQIKNTIPNTNILPEREYILP